MANRQTAGAATQGRATAKDTGPAVDSMAQVNIVVTDANGTEVLSKPINGGFDELPAAIEVANQVVRYGEGITRVRP